MEKAISFQDLYQQVIKGDANDESSTATIFSPQFDKEKMIKRQRSKKWRAGEGVERERKGRREHVARLELASRCE